MKQIVLLILLAGCATSQAEPQPTERLTGVYRFLDGDNIFVGCNEWRCAVPVIRTPVVEQSAVEFNGQVVTALGHYVLPCETGDFPASCWRFGNQRAFLISEWHLSDQEQ